jgi:hypothetical protein
MGNWQIEFATRRRRPALRSRADGRPLWPAPRHQPRRAPGAGAGGAQPARLRRLWIDRHAAGRCDGGVTRGAEMSAPLRGLAGRITLAAAAGHGTVARRRTSSAARGTRRGHVERPARVAIRRRHGRACLPVPCMEPGNRSRVGLQAD